MFHKHASSPHKGVWYTPLWGGRCMFLKHAVSNMHLPLTRVCTPHMWYTPLWGGRCMFLKHAVSNMHLPSQGCVPHTCGIHTLMRGKMYVSETRNIFSKLRDCLFLQTCYTCNRKKVKETNQRKARMDSMMCMTCIFIFF